MTQSFKNTFILFALLASVLLLSACPASTGRGYGDYQRASTPSAPAQSTPNVLDAPATTPQAAAPKPNLPPVKVGLLLPMSGKHKQLGDSMLKAAQMALFEIGHTNMELIPRDTGGTANGAREAARAVVDSGAQLILGPVFAPAVRAAKPITNSARVNMIAFSTDWTLAGGNTYMMGFLPFDQVERIARYSASRGITNVGILSPNTDYGQIVTSAFKTIAPRNGITISQNMNFRTGTTNLAPVVRSFTKYDERQQSGALNQAPFDAVLMPVGGQDARAIGSLLTHYELPPRAVRRLGTGVFDDAALATESNLNGTWFAAPSPNARRSFEQRFLATYGKKAPRLSTLAFDATALAAVLARRGLESTSRPAFDRGSIISPNGFAGLDGIFRFRENNTSERGLAILEFRNGKITVIDEAPKTFQQPAGQQF